LIEFDFDGVFRGIEFIGKSLVSFEYNPGKIAMVEGADAYRK
jgi:hypothetical protein